jgi:hypothetical protein
MSFHNETHVCTISGGTGSFVTNHPLRGLLWQVRIRPESGDNETGNSWVLTVYRNDGTGEVWGIDTEIGDYNTAYGLELPVTRDVLRFEFTECTIDEDITVHLTVKEEPYGR